MTSVYGSTRKRLLKHRKEHKKGLSERLDRLVYWTSLFVLALFNIIACFFLVPLMLITQSYLLYFTLGVFGLSFGVLFNMLIMGIEHLDSHHGTIAAIFIPFLAIIDVLIILAIGEKMKALSGVIMFSSPVFIMIFVAAFVLPYMVSVVMGWHRS